MREQQRGDAGGTDLLASGTGRERDGDRGGLPTWVWRVAGLLVLGLVAVVAGPQLLSSPGPGGLPAASRPRSSAQAAPLVRPVLPRPVQQLRWAPRGPGVGSAVAVAAVARLRAIRPGVDRLLWAGSLDGHDHVVAVSYRRRPNQSPQDPIEIAALHVRRARDVGTANGQTIGYLGLAGLVGMAWEGDDQHTRLLLLGRPVRMRVQISSVVDYDPVGRNSRRWRDARLSHGVVVTDLGRHADPVIVVRSKGGDGSTSPAIIQVQGGPDLPAPDEVTVRGVASPSYAGPNAHQLVATLAQSVSPLFDLRDADATVVWSGKLAGGHHRRGSRALPTGRGALVLVHRLDGPMFQAFVYGAPGFLESYPATPVRWSVAGRLPYLFLPYEPGSPHVIINPGGPGSATFTPTVGRPLQVRLDRNGVGTLPADTRFATRISGARVVVRDPSGHTVLRARMVNPDAANPFMPYLH